MRPARSSILRLDGRTVEVEAIAVPISERGAAATQVVLLDITERKRVEQQVRHLAHHDALTGLPNRALLLDRLRQALRQARRERGRIAVVMLDLDHFKSVNDTPRPPVRRPAAVRGRRAAARPRSARATRSRASAATSSRWSRPGCRSRAAPSVLAREDRRGAGRALRDRRPGGAHHDQHRGRDLPGARHRARAVDRACRHRALPGQGARPQPGRAASPKR